MNKILVTGGGGYIGSHTVVDLAENGFEVISADNFSRSNPLMMAGVEKILSRNIKNYSINLCDYGDTERIFLENPDITGIIHFAAYKFVEESVKEPLLYYENNIGSLINLLKCVEKFKIPYFVFSSSCTVYGVPERVPVTENTPLQKASSPYGATKQMGEQIISDYTGSSALRSILLRYFNPVGAHPSGMIGELPVGKPSNLVPVITQTAIGKIQSMQVHGDDYPTGDGSCIRDYIHVCDIARAHTLGLQYLMNGKPEGFSDIFNLGSGKGNTVLEIIRSFEEVSGHTLNYSIGPRRPGDVPAIYSDNRKAKEKLGWIIKHDLRSMMETAWSWEQQVKNFETT
jgi:UDP-glucose 4-epimerase